ncbi:thiosulfate/3-mercaptopyruvate sulfurtransferase [Hasllibacter halocynthiae]|uniref:Sulfurtransferase n=1 Tax=Hasllibacter halocynthiae TaxID=595589 RepID=A0A2T0X233_9RHOB|nr:3-mercaptopyruvate sulfurtransferase [Hasllibacter halocynthiae]PRY92924.1 thiosulfate/3-mercaptopyruvate sulfurtransferase [Hasllibacter halocynthiae]
MDDPTTLVSTGWLADRLEDPDLRVLDASWHMPAEGRDARAEFDGAHIPGARFFDIDAISDPRSGLPHMAPEPREFGAQAARLGVGEADRVVVYDASGVFSAPRAWWLFRLMGHRDVAVLDGGLPKWLAEGRPVTGGAAAPARERAAPARRRDGIYADAARVADALKRGDRQVVDARAPARFRGEKAEPRPGLRAGHMPGARNVPFGTLLNPDGTMKDPAGLRAAFEAGGVDPARPAITTCGSGITAAVLSLAFARLGNEDVALYDGSWAEWGMESGGDVATGEA